MISTFFRRPIERGSEVPQPPRRLVKFVGGGNALKIGEEFFRYFRELGGLKADERVLDVGCGCGRMAIPLTRFLSARGSYEGFDIDAACIKWCRREITGRHPNFTFQLADIYNKLYNRKGRFQAHEFQFPYESGSIDFVFLTSVFTHLLRREMEHYLDEIARVLKPGGRCLLTYFLLNDEVKALLAAGKGSIAFDHEVAGTRVQQPRCPEAAVAFPADDIVRLLAERGIAVVEPIHWGNWCGRARHLSYQDVVIARRA
jgi:SAM-dependent methyltransferase